MATKVEPYKPCKFNTYVPPFDPRTKLMAAPDPCKDACGAWKKFRVCVQDKPLCITMINPPAEGFEVFRVIRRKGCDVYKPQPKIVLADDECDVLMLKPGTYEFKPCGDATVFPKSFDWTANEITPEMATLMCGEGAGHATV